MIKALFSRLKQGYRTYPFPDKQPAMPAGFMGRPVVSPSKCDNCFKCAEICPTDAISCPDNKLTIDLGKCIFCGKCVSVCGENAIRFSDDYRLAASSRNDLLVSDNEFKLAKALNEKFLKIFGRSLKLRQVSAGGCNACEADTNVLNTLVFDLGRFGIQFVASPRHADGLLITGTVPDNMKPALLKTYQAVAEPKFVIAVGACAISGGIYCNWNNSGAADIVPVDLYIPGCPPHPYTILDGLITFLGHYCSG